MKTYKMSSTARSVYGLVLLGKDGELETGQDYQRGEVWGVERKRALIYSLLRGLPIGALIVNDRHSADFAEYPEGDPRNWCFAVIDGKQRLSAVIGFTAGAFSVSADWFDPNMVESSTEQQVTFSQLAAAARRRFENIPVSICEAQLPTLAEEREVFSLVNCGGLPQGDVDADL